MAGPGPLPASAMLLADGRFPAGGHSHSGGAEEAVAQGRVTDAASLTAFLEGRLSTIGSVSAGLAAGACRLAAEARVLPMARRWAALDAEADARTPSPAQRRASRRQGRHLMRAALRSWPDGVLDEVAGLGPDPHHPMALGATAHAAGLGPAQAAAWAAYAAAAGPAWAALRLLALDPSQVSAVLAGLAPCVDGVAAAAASALYGHGPDDDDAWMALLPANGGPLLDMLAEDHDHREVRLFAS